MGRTSSTARAMLAASASCLICSLAPHGALAQTDRPAAAPGALEEVIVTSRKRAEAITDNPTSVTALTAQQLDARGVTGYRQLNQFVPGFRWQTQNGSTATRIFNSFVMRGISGDTPDRANVSIFIDGVPVGGGGSIPGLTDVTQVEIVKGPQSAYFGRSTFAGAVSFTTAPPAMDFGAKIDVSLGSKGQQELRASVEGPIIKDVLSVRLSGRHNSTGVFDSNYVYGGDLGEQKTDSVALAVLFKPTPWARFRGYHTQWEDNDKPNATDWRLSPDYNCATRPGNAALNYICGEISSLRGDRITQNTTVPHRYLDQLTALNRTQGSGFITDYGLHREARFSTVSGTIDLPYGFSLDGNAGLVKNTFGQMQDSASRVETIAGRYAVNLTAWKVENKLAEVRLSSNPSRRLRGMVGLNYFHQEAEVSAFTYIILPTTPNPTPSVNLSRVTKTKNTSVFGSVSLDITSKLELDLEGRYQKETVDERGLLVGNIQIGGETTAFLPRAIVKYKLTDDVNVYGSYSKGTRGAAPNTNFYSLPASAQAQVVAQSGPIPRLVPEETVEMYELGLKGEFFDRRVRLLAAVYQGQYTDRQINQTFFYTNAAGNPAQAIVLVPNGATDLKGYEVDARWRALDYLTLEGTLGYSGTKIKFTNDAAAAAILLNSNPVGNRINFYPATTASASATFALNVFSRPATIRVDYVYTGRIYADVSNLLWLAPQNVVNVNAGMDFDRYRVEVWGRNVLNDTVPTSIARTTDVYNGSNAVTLTPQERPSVGVRVSAAF